MMQERAAGAFIVIQHESQPVGKRVEIWKDYTTIGRSRDCDIFLEDVTVHRKQASIIYTDAGYVLHDDHGSGDSLLNGTPVQEEFLNDGDQLLFGNTHLTFYLQATTRPFPQASTKGQGLQMHKRFDPQASVIAKLHISSQHASNQQDTPRSFDLQPEMTIGRSRDCSIFLEDLAVSRVHATIRQMPDGSYELEDHQSATGTLVNGRAVTRCRLQEGDVVQIGANRLTFRFA
jgi:pSer/pThr/pTyr-binding forkhead associated (FHA) protein